MKKGTVFRRFITFPIGLRPTVIEFPIQRALCRACGMTRQVKIGFAERRQLYREATDLLHKDGLKGTRWLLLKNLENLNDDRNERARLEEALSINKPLATAYYMKEDLRLLRLLPDKATAEAHLQDWMARAETSGIRILKDFANTLRTHRRGILAYYDHPISTGQLEGTNNKIKTLQRQTYGFRDRTFFILRIYALHTAKHKLIG